MSIGVNKSTRLKLIVVLAFTFFLVSAFWRDETHATKQQTAASPKPTASPERQTAPAATPGPAAAAPSTAKAADTPTEGCVKCHTNIEPMHRYNATGDVFDKLVDGRDAQGLSCTGCHGGNPSATTQNAAHVKPKFPKQWGCNKPDGGCSSRNPERSNTLLTKESREFVRFVNPGDFRVVQQSCGECHTDENAKVSQGMMAHGAMLWGAALYNNGGFPIKDAHFGESYDENGYPQELVQKPAPTREQQAFKGFLSILDPLPRWELSQPGNILRVFERGGKRRLEVGNPDK